MTEPGERASSEGRLGNVSGALLLGGLASCGGCDEAGLTRFEAELATRLARILDRLYLDVLLVGGTPLPGAPGRAVAEPPGAGDRQCALKGLVTALAEGRAERVQVVAADLPLVTPDLLLALTAWPESQAVVPRDELGVHPLCAIYQRESVLSVARARLEAGHDSLEGLLTELDTAYFEGPDLAAVDPDGAALLAVDTRGEVEGRVLEALEWGDYEELPPEFRAELRSRGTKG